MYKYLSQKSFLVLIAFCAVIIYQLFKIGSGYLPVWSDEYSYYTYSLGFFETSSLAAPLSLTLHGSFYFGGDPHGIMYPLLYGGIAKIIGWHDTTFVYFNILALLIPLVIISLSPKIDYKSKFAVSAIIVLFPFFYLYAFTFMQECLHVSVGISLGYLLFRMSLDNSRKKYLLLYLGFIIIAGLFRPLWFFWVVGIIPFLQSGKERRLGYIIVVLFFIAAVLVSFLMFEPVPSFLSSVIGSLLSGQVLPAIQLTLDHIKVNLYQYAIFGIQYEFPLAVLCLFFKYSLLFFTSLWIYMALKTKKKIYLSLVLISVLNMVLLICVYDAFEWRDIRTMAPLMYCNLLFLALGFPRLRVVYAFLLFPLAFYSFTLSNIRIVERRKTESEIEIVGKMKSELSKVIVKPNIYMESIPPDFTLELVGLPLKNTNGVKLHYIVPAYSPTPCDSNIHYLFTRNVYLNKPLVWKNSEYYMYENIVLAD